ARRRPAGHPHRPGRGGGGRPGCGRAGPGRRPGAAGTAGPGKGPGSGAALFRRPDHRGDRRGHGKLAGHGEAALAGRPCLAVRGPGLPRRPPLSRPAAPRLRRAWANPPPFSAPNAMGGPVMPRTPIRTRWLASLLAACTAFAAHAQSGPVQWVAIIDPNGFETPMPAHWVELPAGWQTQGGVLWDQAAPCGATPSLRWQAHSPDGSQRLSVHPAEAWTWDNTGLPPTRGRCPRVPITSARQYLDSWIQRHRPGARLLDYRDRPDLITTPPPPDGAGTQWRKEAGEYLLAYVDQGVEVRESVAVVTLFSHMSMPGVVPGEVRQFMTGFAMGATTLRAPAGRLPLDLLARFSASIQVDPQWQARMNRHNQVIARQGTEGMRRRGQIVADTN